MSVSWRDTFDASTDWTNVAVMQMFYAALKERKWACGTSESTVIGVGQDAALVTKWSYLQSGVEGVVENFIDPSVPYPVDPPTGVGTTAPTPPTWTETAWRTAAGINTAGFRRKRPREISSLSATADTQGNARATGHVAWYTGSTPGPYTFDGTAWTLTPTAEVDTLDSNAGTVAYGNAQAGDYMGPWILNELRAGLNKLVWLISATTTSDGFGDDGTYTHEDRSGNSYGHPYDYTDPGGAESDAESHWSGATASSTGTSSAKGVLGLSSGDGPGPYDTTVHYAASILTFRCRFKSMYHIKAVGHHVDVYIYCSQGGASDRDYYVHEFDDTYGPGEDEWTKWDTIAVTGTGSLTPGTVFGTRILGTNTSHGDFIEGFPTDEHGHGSSERLFYVICSIGIAKYDVTGGFQYVAA